MTHLAFARGGIDLDVAGRADAARISDASRAGIIVAVTARREALCENNHLVDVSGETGLWSQASPSCRLENGRLYYLGIVEGHPIYGVLVTDTEASHLLTGRRSWIPLRATTGLHDWEMTALAHTTALAAWWSSDHYCPGCGSRVAVAQCGWEQLCRDCGRTTYPRQDPSIIVAITDANERLLLAKNSAWHARSVSLIAGFIEAGEAPELAVAREAYEETGLQVRDVSYVGSQAWPFPHSLMLGFHARALDTAISCDGSEIAWARWWSRDGFREARRLGAITTPPEATIAASLIDEWLNPFPHRVE